MRELEAIDRTQRTLDLPAAERLRALAPDAGVALAALAADVPPGPDFTFVELGTGAGYSTLWLVHATAARAPAPSIVTVEADPAKHTRAADTFARAGVADRVEQRLGDAAAEVATLGPIALAFFDHGPQRYELARPAVVERLVPGGVLVADNVVSHAAIVAPFIAALATDGRFSLDVLPLGRGLLVARRR